MNTLDFIKRWYRGLPDKKRYIEFITAILTVPVLVTVLISNTNTIKNQSKLAATAVPSTPLPLVTAASPPQQNSTGTATIIYVPQASPTESTSPVATPALECRKGIGPVSIEYPQENEVVSINPICINVTRQSSEYCSIVWSYRINNEEWSDFLDKSICVYGLTPGLKQLQLKIRSVATNEVEILYRNFSVFDPSPATQSAIFQ